MARDILSRVRQVLLFDEFGCCLDVGFERRNRRAL